MLITFVGNVIGFAPATLPVIEGNVDEPTIPGPVQEYVTPEAGFEVTVDDCVKFKQVITPVAADVVSVGWLIDGTTVNTKEATQPVVGCEDNSV